MNEADGKTVRGSRARRSACTQRWGGSLSSSIDREPEIDELQHSSVRQVRQQRSWHGLAAPQERHAAGKCTPSCCLTAAPHLPAERRKDNADQHGGCGVEGGKQALHIMYCTRGPQATSAPQLGRRLVSASIKTSR